MNDLKDKGKFGLYLLMLSLFITLLELNCGSTGPRTLESAESSASVYFHDNIVIDGDISEKLLEGPILVDETDDEFVFQWGAKAPIPGETYCEVTVPKRSGEIYSKITGRRKNLSRLGHTRDFPLNEAMLINLFNLPTSPDFKDEHTRRLSEVPLNTGQLEDVANFMDISWELTEYASCMNCRYPDSLYELNTFKNSGTCNVHKLDCFFLTDRYGHQYYYTCLLGFIILGSPGENGKWDLDKAVLDSVYYEQIDQIQRTDDDIIVKFKPLSRCD